PKTKSWVGLVDVWLAATAGAAVGVRRAALAPLGGVGAHAARAGLPGHRRIAVVAAERDEHLVLGRDAAAARTRVADAVGRAGSAVALPVVGLEAGGITLARLTALRFVQARDTEVAREAGRHETRTTGGQRTERRRDRRHRVALHVRRIGQAVVVERAELE